MIYLLHLDDYHLDDLLFVQSLGRMLVGNRLPVVLVHGSGGGAEGLLEGQGLFPGKRDGRFVNLTQEEKRLVEQGYRQTNRLLVGKLTDSGVSAVGLHGGDRGLLHRAGEGVEPGELGWLRALVQNGAAPVVSTLLATADGVEPVVPHQALAALAAGLAPDAAVVALTRTGQAGLGTPHLAAEALAEHAAALADSGAATGVAATGTPLLVTTLPAFLAASGPSGTWVGQKIAPE